MASRPKKRKTAAVPKPAVHHAGDSSSSSGIGSAAASIEYLDSFKTLQESWPEDMRRLLDPSLPDERRSELWEMMCEGGDVLRQRCVTCTSIDVCPRLLHVPYTLATAVQHCR